jgi:hypothetical protein
MDKLLKSMKNEFEDYLNPDKVFSEQEKRRVLNKIKHPAVKPVQGSFILKLTSITTLVSLCVLIVFLAVNFTGLGEKSQPANLHKDTKPLEKEPPKSIPEYTDEDIVKKAAVIENSLRLGMTEKEVIELLGKDYKNLDNSDSEDGSVKRIGYNLLVNEPGFTFKFSDSIDVDSLLKKHIGVQVFIGFSNNDEVMWSSISYAEDDVVYTKLNNANGKTVEKYNPETQLFERIAEEKKYYETEAEFALTDEEQVVYNKFLQDLDENHLKDLSPKSIAKLYVQSRLDRRNDATYALYTDREGFVQWTKEEDESFLEEDRGTIEQIRKVFKNLENGVFIQTGEFEGYIEYWESKDAEAKSGFRMIKDEDGIWNVGFMPIQ